MAAVIGATVMVTGLAVAVTPALAATGHTYCDNNLAPGGTCPPNGVNGGVKEGHIIEGQGNAAGASHETCVDSFLEYNGYRAYSAAECMYYAGETAVIYGYERLGIVRAWNGGKVTHTVWGWEYYN